MSVGDEFSHCVDESLLDCSAVGLVLCHVHKCHVHCRGRREVLLSSADDVTY